MSNNRIDDLMKKLKSMGPDVTVSSGRNTADGKTSVCASSDNKTNFSSNLIAIEKLACNHGVKIVRIEKTFLELTDY